MSSLRMRFVLCVPLGLIAAGLFAVRLANAQEVFCGMGPPPDADSLAQYLRRQFDQETVLGYKLVCEEDIDAALGRLRIWKRPWLGMPKLAFKPVPLEGTPFATYELLRQTSDNFGGKGATALSRTFRTPEGRYVELFEWDMSVDGGAINSLDPRPPSEDVNRWPARLYVMQSRSGRAISLVTWTESWRDYILRVDYNARSEIRPNLLQLARSLPKSEPAGFTDGLKRLPPNLEGK